MYRFIIFTCIIIAVSCDVPESRTVRLAQGVVRGYKDPHVDVFAFYSIPYATAPTGHERFKAPLPPPVWSEAFEAVDKQIACPQHDYTSILQKTLNMQEDCLIANIYVPETNKLNLPVVVYVHGGGYVMGWGNHITPKKMVETKKMIAVTFNYRLGAHGFLCLGTKDVPGNAGMKDQVALLRWVKKNIAEFGGNPDEITIAGNSAGSSAVDLLMISKMAQGLFKRVIPESGSNTGPFSVQSDPILNAKEYAKMLNFQNVDDFYALENFYKSVSYDDLSAPDLTTRPDSTFLFSPCVERDVGEEMFFDNDPVSILKSGSFEKLPMLYGFAEMEGLMRVPFFEVWKNRMNEKFSDFLPADLHFKNENEKEQVANEIKTFYFGNESVRNKSILDYINYFTDVMFGHPTLRSVKLQVESGNNQIYLYEYSFVDDDTPLVPYTNIRGANHCTQTVAVLDIYTNETGKPDQNISEDFKKMKEVMREIWLNFITTGKPIHADSKLPAWPPVGADWSPHMSLNKSLELRGSLLKKRTLFWEGIYNKYYRYPSAPPAPPPTKTEL